MFLGLFSWDILWIVNGVPQNMDFTARIKKRTQNGGQQASGNRPEDLIESICQQIDNPKPGLIAWLWVFKQLRLS